MKSSGPGIGLRTREWRPADHGRRAVSEANPARVYNYLVGGKDNYLADYEQAQRFLGVAPEVRDTALSNRRFVHRTVRHLASGGISQFLDIGAGLPANPNVHEIAQAVNPRARVVYADNDPIVASHGQARLTVSGTTMVRADVRSPDDLLGHEELRRLLDPGQPVAILLTLVLDYIEDREDPIGIVRRLMDWAAPGSCLVLSHGTGDFTLDTDREWEVISFEDPVSLVARDRDQIMEYFSGLELLDPGLVQLPSWRPGIGAESDPSRVWAYGGVARKP
ncbi:SAM-dependent methyltransferase [Streptomyces hygroscopicus]|uniref:SAM-dependent methyltransferase n=1 Tax=Streptomyces hygroscopicus TaxID=1912 RepID=UPI0007674522|nr:SAM-dependent methyltransferase [Streptomyces hygroscopicus]